MYLPVQESAIQLGCLPWAKVRAWGVRMPVSPTNATEAWHARGGSSLGQTPHPSTGCLSNERRVRMEQYTDLDKKGDPWYSCIDCCPRGHCCRRKHMCVPAMSEQRRRNIASRSSPAINSSRISQHPSKGCSQRQDNLNRTANA